MSIELICRLRLSDGRTVEIPLEDAERLGIIKKPKTKTGKPYINGTPKTAYHIARTKASSVWDERIEKILSVLPKGAKHGAIHLARETGIPYGRLMDTLYVMMKRGLVKREWVRRERGYGGQFLWMRP